MKRPGMSRTHAENWERFLAMPIPKRGATQEAIAKAAGVTKARVQQIEAQALKKLYDLLRARQEELNDSAGDERSVIY